MLVLGRKCNESIVVNGNITITVLGVDGDRVKLGIQAPPEVAILRQELYETVKQENLRAVNLSAQSGAKLLPSLQDLFKGGNG